MEDGNQTSRFMLSFPLPPTAAFALLIGTILFLFFLFNSPKSGRHSPFSYFCTLPFLLSPFLKMKINVQGQQVDNSVNPAVTA